MASHPNSLKNLKGQPRPDAPKNPKSSGVVFEEEDLEWLKTLPHGVSYNVREAVRLLKKHYGCL